MSWNWTASGPVKLDEAKRQKAIARAAYLKKRLRGISLFDVHTLKEHKVGDVIPQKLVNNLYNYWKSVPKRNLTDDGKCYFYASRKKLLLLHTAEILGVTDVLDVRLS